MRSNQKAYDTAALFAAVTERIRQEMLEMTSSEGDSNFHNQTIEILFDGLGNMTTPIVFTYTIEEGKRKLVFEFRVELQVSDDNDSDSESQP